MFLVRYVMLSFFFLRWCPGRSVGSVITSSEGFEAVVWTGDWVDIKTE